MTWLDFLSNYGIRLFQGTLVTLEQFALAAVLVIVLAFAGGLMLLSPRGLVRAPARGYVEFFRGTSLLIQLYWIFYALPLFGLSLDKFTAGVLAVGLCLGAYGANLVKGAIEAVPRGQWEAAVALNIGSTRRMIRIILPQALLILLPSWGNLMIELLKATALVALISVTDLMFEARRINAETFLAAQAFGTALIIYYVIARFAITPVMRYLERILARALGRVPS